MKVRSFLVGVASWQLITITLIASSFISRAASAHFFGHGEAVLTPPIVADAEELRALKADFGGGAPALRGVFNQLNLWNTGSMLTACFYDGDSKLKAFFSRIAREWLEGTSLQIDFGESAGLRSCNDAPNADIRITFAQKGSWSFIGTDSLSQQVLQKGASLSIETNGAPFERLNQQRFEETILHEVGHALGLLHEHQSPESKCDEEFDWTKIFDFGTKYLRWDNQTVRDNFNAYFLSPRLRTTAYDRQSIMHYSLPEWMFKSGKNSPCYVPQPTAISKLDRVTILAAYPVQTAQQDKQLQSLADTAGALMGQLNLTATQLGKVGKRISASVRHFRRKVKLQFALAPQDPLRRPGGLDLNPCEGSSVKLPSTTTVSCGVTPDGSLLVIEVDPHSQP